MVIERRCLACVNVESMAKTMLLVLWRYLRFMRHRTHISSKRHHLTQFSEQEFSTPTIVVDEKNLILIHRYFQILV